jgi:prepilin-type N-terminal cleavage/methylation domain-containing protein
MTRFSKGFSLVELSVVLVIIALLISGALVGKNLIESAELKAMMSMVNEYKSGIEQFDLRYGGMPGDINDAEDYWAAPVANGDANGEINSEFSSGAIIAGNKNEPFQALLQLTEAKMIKMNVTINGVWGSGFVAGSSSTTGNVPPASDDMYIYIRCCSDSDYARTPEFNNHINIFAIHSDNEYRDGVVTPIQAKAIDEKMDDGLPDAGFVAAGAGWNGTNYSTTAPCYTGTGTTSSYESDNANLNESNGCQLLFAYDWD